MNDVATIENLNFTLNTQRKRGRFDALIHTKWQSATDSHFNDFTKINKNTKRITTFSLPVCECVCVSCVAVAA